MGDTNKAYQYFNEARRHMEYLFDTFDYSVAEALFGMQYLCGNLGDMEKALYYGHMARNICAQLEAQNSATYTRCLLFEFVLPSTTLAERRVMLRDYVRRLKQQPYYDHRLATPYETLLRQYLDYGSRVLITVFMSFAMIDSMQQERGASGDELSPHEIRILEMLLQKIIKLEKLVCTGMSTP